MFSEPNGRYLGRFFTVLPPVTELGEIAPAIQAGRPEILVLDIMFGRRNSLDHLPAWIKQFPETQVLIATGHSEAALVERAFSCGARGIVHKEDGPATLLRAVRAILHGESFVPSDLRVAARPDCCRLRAPLSPREAEVLARLHSGMTYAESAMALNVSDRTIEKHARAIRIKLGIERSAQRILWTKIRVEHS